MTVRQQLERLNRRQTMTRAAGIPGDPPSRARTELFRARLAAAAAVLFRVACIEVPALVRHVCKSAYLYARIGVNRWYVLRDERRRRLEHDGVDITLSIERAGWDAFKNRGAVCYVCMPDGLYRLDARGATKVSEPIDIARLTLQEREHDAIL